MRNLSNHVADEAGLIEINSKRFELCARKWRNVEPDKLGRTLSILLILPVSTRLAARRCPPDSLDRALLAKNDAGSQCRNPAMRMSSRDARRA